MTIEEALEHPFIKEHAALIYTTSSHKPDWDKFRIVFILPQVVSAQTVEVLVREVMKYIPHDPACKDASRVFYGNTDAEFPLTNPNAVLPGEWIAQSIAIAQEEEKQRIKRITEQKLRTQKLREEYSAEGLDKLVDEALDKIPTRQPGSNNYEECLQVLMALNAEYGAVEGQQIAENWSPSIPGTTWLLDKKFKSFGSRSGGITIATLFHIAKQYGFEFPKTKAKKKYQEGSKKPADPERLHRRLQEQQEQDEFVSRLGIQFQNTIETTISDAVFCEDWVVLDGTFYQYLQLGFYRKATQEEVIKLIMDNLRQVFDIDIKTGKIIYSFATERNRAACFKWASYDIAKKKPANEHLIAFLNGTLNLTTRRLEESSPDNLLTWCVNADYEPNKPCPDTFKKFVEDSFGLEYLELIQALIYYFIDPTAPYNFFLHVIGESGSGKGTLIRFISSLFGKSNVAAVTNIGSLASKEDRHQILSGVRLCTLPDIAGFQSSVQSFYELVDNGELSGRALYKSETYTKQWNVKFILGSVSALNIENSADGWDRRCIPLKTKGKPTNPNYNLGQELEACKAEVISWALSMKRDRRNYLIQNASKEFTDIRDLKQEQAIQSDSIKSFIDQCLELTGDDKDYIPMTLLYAAYEQFCKATGVKTLGSTKFIARTAEFLKEYHRKRTSKKQGGMKYNIPRRLVGFVHTASLFTRESNPVTGEFEYTIHREYLSEGTINDIENARKNILYSGCTQSTNQTLSTAENQSDKGIQVSYSGYSVTQGKSKVYGEINNLNSENSKDDNSVKKEINTAQMNNSNNDNNDLFNLDFEKFTPSRMSTPEYDSQESVTAGNSAVLRVPEITLSTPEYTLNTGKEEVKDDEIMKENEGQNAQQRTLELDIPRDNSYIGDFGRVKYDSAWDDESAYLAAKVGEYLEEVDD